MTKMLRYCFLLTILLGVSHVHAQTVVYDNPFTAISGFPPAGFVLTNGNSDLTPGSDAGAQIGGSVGSIVLTSDQLATWVTCATVPPGLTNNGYAAAMQPLSVYSAPFDPILSDNTMVISWAFNMQTGASASGFSDGRDNAAVILTCDNPDVRHFGKGYGVAFDPTSPDGLMLFSYSGGLLGTITPIITTGSFMGSPTNYTSVRVLYDPTTDDWTLFVRDDGPFAFDDPTTGILFGAGTATDITYTGSAMTHFGFYSNYSVNFTGFGPDALNAYFDNFSVSMLCADIVGGLETCIGSHITLSHPIPGGTWSSFGPTVGTVGASTGIVTGISADTVTIAYTAGDCYVTAVVTVDPTVIAPITGDTIICRYETTTLANTVPFGIWSNYYGTIGFIDAFTGDYTASESGTDTVVYEVFPGCSTIRTIHVDSVEAIEGPGLVCPTGTITMTNAVAGGTWLSGDVTKFTVASTTGVVTGVAVGTGTLTYTTPAGCRSFFTITVNAAPATITGDRYICVGATSALSSTPPGGTWASSDASVASIDAAGVITGAGTGTATITYSATGCFTTAVVTVDPTPGAITGTASMCAGSSQTLTPPTTGGTWTSSNTAIATVGLSSGTVTGVITTGGTCTITYHMPSSGCIVTRVVTVLALPNAITGSLTVCVGSTTTLSTTTPSPSWTSSNTTVATVGASSGVVSGNTAGTSTIVGTGPNGCSRSVVVTVNALPAALTGTQTVCIAATTTFTSTTTGGTWLSGNIIVASVSGGTITGISTGTANITYTANGCQATRVVSVLALPSAFTGPSTVCAGQTVTLNSTPTTGTWTSGNTTVAPVGATTGVVTGSSSGTAVITYTIPNACYRTRTMTVNALPPAIGGPTLLCPGSTATLTNTATPGTWFSSNTPVATIVTGTGAYTGVASGTSTISYTQTSTGCVTTVVVTISSAPPAVLNAIGDTVMCPGDFVTLTVSTSPGVSYQWYNASGPIPGAGSPTHVVSTSGVYHAVVSVAAGCSSTSVPMTVTVTPVAATITVAGGSTTTCAGTPVVLNANTGTGLTYQWELAGSPIAGATGSTFNAAASGSYAVRVTNPAGCWAVSSPVTITASPLPSNAVVASGPLTICNGSSVSFTASSGTGYTYQWYDGSGPIAGATSMTYAATMAGSYYVTVTSSIGCTATSGTSVVVVNPTPDVSITPGGTRIFCAGGSVLLDAAPGFNYQWYVGGVLIPGATNASYYATTSGGYRVRVTNGATGCSDITHADTVVTVLSSFTTVALTPARFCWGGSALLSTNVSTLGSALSYQWYFNGVPIPGATGPTYSASAVGLYNARVSVPSSCTALTNNIEVSQVPLPDPPIAYNGTSVYSATYYVSYQWYKNLMPIPGATSWSTPATGNGNYKVAVTDTNGCQSVSAIYVLTGWTGPTAVTNVNNPEIRIYPVPARDVVTIESPVTVRAVISSVDGKMLIDQADAHSITLKGLADGLYIITLFDAAGQQVKTQKLVKQQ